MREGGGDAVGSSRSMADVNLRNDADFAGIACSKRFCELRRLSPLNKVDSAASEASAGETRADKPWEVPGKVDHGVGLDTTGFKITTIADMGFGHEPANLG